MSDIVIAKHRPLNISFLVGVGGLLIFLGALVGVDPSGVTPTFLRPIWRPAMAVGSLLFLILLLVHLRARGRVLVGGPTWLVEYRAMAISPMKSRVQIEEKGHLRLTVQPLRSELAIGQFKSWVELVVRKANGDEVIRCSANPKFLRSDYQQKFEEWKQL